MITLTTLTTSFATSDNLNENLNLSNKQFLSNKNATLIIQKMIEEIIKSDNKSHEIYLNIIKNLEISKYDEFDKEIPPDYKIRSDDLLIYLEYEKNKLFRSYDWTQDNSPQYIKYVFDRISNIIFNWSVEINNNMIGKTQKEIYEYCKNLFNQIQILKNKKNILKSNDQNYDIINESEQKEIENLIKINNLKFLVVSSLIEDKNKIINLQNDLNSENFIFVNLQNIIDESLETQLIL